MSEAGTPRPLVLGPDVVPEVDGHQRRGVILIQYDAEAIAEAVVNK